MKTSHHTVSQLVFQSVKTTALFLLFGGVTILFASNGLPAIEDTLAGIENAKDVLGFLAS